jgi:hypothetical protein
LAQEKTCQIDIDNCLEANQWNEDFSFYANDTSAFFVDIVDAPDDIDDCECNIRACRWSIRPEIDDMDMRETDRGRGMR